MSKLITAEIFYDEGTVRAAGIPVALWANTLYQDPNTLVTPAGDADDPTVAAYVNEGRWVVDCPFGCGSAQVASELDRRYYCVGCQNYSAFNFTIPVIWPDDVTQLNIEDLLTERPAVFRNWFPWEQPAQLVAENAVRGEVI